MKENKYFLNTALALVLGVAGVIAVLVRTFAPNFIIPSLDIPNLVLLSLVTLVVDHYAAPNAQRCWICIPVLSAVAFGLLPWCACVVAGTEVLKLAVAGGVVFTITTWLYTSIQDRLSTGPAAKAAPVVSAFGLYLAFQCFSGWIL